MKSRIEGARLGSVAIGVIVAALFVARAGDAAASPSRPPGAPCFFITQWNGWKSPSPNVIYLGVNLHDVYRVDLSAGSPQLQWPDVHLVSRVTGSDSICTALDLQLEVSDDNGFSAPLIASRLTKLTPLEVSAIPKRFLPN